MFVFDEKAGLGRVAQLAGVAQCTERWTVQFPVRARAGVAGWVRSSEHAGGSGSASHHHISASLSLFLSLPISLKINLKTLKKRKRALKVNNLPSPREARKKVRAKPKGRNKDDKNL